MSELKYWLWLSRLQALGIRGAHLVLEQLQSPKEAFFADRAALDAVRALRREERSALLNKRLDEVYQIMDACDKLGLQVITLQDAIYPERLRNIENPPLVLYGKGTLPVMDEMAAVAIVGTRRATDYGKHCAFQFGREIALAGGVVVSGLALGIDTEGARGALEENGTVVGVLGCGLDVVYPKENKALYAAVARSGVLLSEYPPGTKPLSGNFPARNRILSGLSAGVLVVEAPEKSGALITASRALEQGRELFAVPGNISMPTFVGSNRLIEDGCCKAVSRGADILREFEGLYRWRYRFLATDEADPPEFDAKTGTSLKKEIDKADEKDYIDLQEQLRALDADELQVLSVLKEDPLHVDAVIEQTGLQTRCVLSALTLLEIKGFVRQHAGKRFSLILTIRSDALSGLSAERTDRSGSV